MFTAIDKFIKENSKIILTILVFFAFYFFVSSLFPLMEPDEGRYAEIPREMLFYKDFILPKLNGVLYFEKPPLYYWLNSISFYLFGISPLTSRLWSIFFSVSTILFSGITARKIFGSEIENIAELILGSSLLFMGLSCFNTIDMTLTFFLTFSIGNFILALNFNLSKKYFIYMFVGAAFATLTKGLIGILIPGAIIFFFLLFTNSWRVLKKVPWFSGILFFLLIAAPWHILAALKNDDFLYFYFIREHFLRYTTDIAKRVQPWYFFIVITPIGLFPWTLVLFKIVKDIFKNFQKTIKNKNKIFLLIWFFFPIIFFSLSHSKLITYILPVFPPFAIIASKEIYQKFKKEGKNVVS